jgi:hypothetical protein
MRKTFQDNYPTKPPMKQIERVGRDRKQRYQRVIPAREQNKRNEVSDCNDTKPVSHSARERILARVVKGYRHHAHDDIHAEQSSNEEGVESGW